MILSNLKIKNFKALVDHNIDFANITVLAGSNSAGKSTTIQSILLIRSVIEKIQSKNLDSVHDKLNFPLNGPYMLSLGNTKEVISWEQGKTFEIKLNNEELDFYFQASSLDDRNFFIDVNFPKLKGSVLNIVNNNFYYLNAERNGPRIRHWVNENPNILHTGFRGEYTIDILARCGDNPDYFIDEKKSLKGKKVLGSPSLANYTQQWMDFIIPGVEVNQALILGDIRSSSIKFNTFFSPPNVGFGISYVLPIVVTGLLACEGTTLIVENPEAHLHPKGQSNIGYFLSIIAAAGIQVIVETHSEHVINGIRLASLENDNLNPEDVNIVFFNKEKETNELRIRNIKTNAKGDLTDFPIDFFDQAQQDLLKIYTLSREKNKNG